MSLLPRRLLRVFKAFKNIQSVGFVEEGTPEITEKPAGQEQEPTNRTHMMESNLGHIGGKQTFSPLWHPCSPHTQEMSVCLG